MVECLEELIENWKSLKQGGKGYFELFQETQASFGDRYFPFGVGGSKMRRIGKNHEIQVNEWIRMEDHIISHFGLARDFFIHDSILDSKSKYQIFVELKSLKNKLGWLFLYGEATRDVAGRLGTYYLAVEGNYDTLQKTFSHFQKNPIEIRRFVEIVFGWKNMPAYSVPNRYLEIGKQLELLEVEKARFLDLETASNLAYYSPIGRQLDILAEAKEAHFLDIGKGYSWYKKWKIGHNWNPEVKTIKILS